MSTSIIKKMFSSSALPQTESSSIQGRKPSQEDSLLITEVRHGMRLVFVADGVGGHGHGDFASKTVVDYFNDAFNALDVDTDPIAFLNITVIKAARKVLDKSLSAPERISMMSIIPSGDERTSMGARQHLVFFANSNPAQGKLHLTVPVADSASVWVALYNGHGL
jgi:serine/threonine protein phosphatase PrpC